jgi:hypothetical protein
VDDLLDEVEETFDAFLDDAEAAPVRITLDVDEGERARQVAVPAAELQQVDETLSGVAQALMLLEGSLTADDLRELVRTLADESMRCSERVRRRLTDSDRS